MRCRHEPHCPPCDAPDREAARVMIAHPEQGWSLLCNGVVSFDDTGDLLPDGQVIDPHRATAPSQRRAAHDDLGDVSGPSAA